MTHLFNAMQSFHHRDPGLVGLLTSEKLAGSKVWCGIISDGVHTHPAALRIAYKTSFEQMVLVTDAIIAMGFQDGRYKFGQQTIEVKGDQAFVADTQAFIHNCIISCKSTSKFQTLTGSVATMQSSVSKFIKFSRYEVSKTKCCFHINNYRCSVVEALEAASLHPAKAMNISDRKGTLNYGADADFVMLRPGDLSVQSTWIAGDCVYSA